MQYRNLGNTGLSVSTLSFGASPLGGVFGSLDESEGIQTVHTAIDAGINLFDVSPYYGITQAETVLGQALVGLRDRVILATKAGRIEADVFNFRKAAIKSSVDDSLRRLRTDYVDILQAHDIEFGERSLIVDETYETLIELREAGKCRFIGMTAFPLHVLADVLTACQLDVVLSYGHFCLYNTLMLDKLLPLAGSRGTGLINASATGMGLLTDRVLTGLPDWHPAPPNLVEACKNAVQHCRSRGANITDLALQYVLEDAGVPTTLVGMSKVRHLSQNLRAAESQPDTRLLAEVLEILEPVMNTSWPSGIWDAEETMEAKEI